MANLARPVFETGPKDPIDIVDVYKVVDPEVRNKLTSKLSSFGSSLNEVFSAGMRSISNLGAEIKAGRVNLDQAVQRVNNALSGSRGDIISLATSVQNSIFSELTGVEPGTNYVRSATDLYDSIQVIQGNAKHVFNNGNISSVRACLGFISDLTGNPIFESLDLGAEAALVKGIIIEASQWGVPDLIDNLLDKYDDDFRYSVISRSSSSIVNTSNIDTLEYYVDKGMASALTNQVPDFAEHFIANYVFPEGTTPGDYPARLTQLVKVLTALRPDWFKTYRGTVNSGGETRPREVINLSILSRVSEHARLLFESDDLYRTAVLCAGNFPKVDLVQLVKQNYPLVGILR